MPSFLQIGDRRYEYRWAGPPPDETTTLVFLHHGLGSVSTWRDFPDQVSEETGLGALVYSREGYGRSDPYPPPWPLTYMEDHALEVLPRILARTAVQKAILIGHSDGGSIAAVYAGGSGDLRARGLVLMAPHFFNEPFGLRRIGQIIDEFTAGDMRASLEKHHGANVENAFWGWADAWRNPRFASWNIEEYLDYIRVPILAIQGVNDLNGSLRQVEVIAETCTCPVELLVLADCGHEPHKEKPAETREAIVAFVRRLVEVHGEKVR